MGTSAVLPVFRVPSLGCTPPVAMISDEENLVVGAELRQEQQTTRRIGMASLILSVVALLGVAFLGVKPAGQTTQMSDPGSIVSFWPALKIGNGDCVTNSRGKYIVCDNERKKDGHRVQIKVVPRQVGADNCGTSQEENFAVDDGMMGSPTPVKKGGC